METELLRIFSVLNRSKIGNYVIILIPSWMGMSIPYQLTGNAQCPFPFPLLIQCYVLYAGEWGVGMSISFHPMLAYQMGHHCLSLLHRLFFPPAACSLHLHSDPLILKSCANMTEKGGRGGALGRGCNYNSLGQGSGVHGRDERKNDWRWRRYGWFRNFGNVMWDNRLEVWFFSSKRWKLRKKSKVGGSSNF